MRLLLDSEPDRLSGLARQAIRDRENQITVSFASFWEITIKIGKGRLPELGSSIQYFLDEVREQRFELLQIRAEHLFALGTLRPHHRDPFDRLLIAQGIAERLPVVTNDPAFSLYPVEIFW